MDRIREIWTDELPPLPEGQLERIRSTAREDMFQTCACFWLFRFLHLREDAVCTLAGDYCFGRFSRHLAELDSVELTDRFGDHLRRDTQRAMALEEYLEFVREIAGVS